MTTKNYLKQISRFEFMIANKKREIDNLDIMIHGTTSSGINPDKVQTSMNGDKMADSVGKLVDLQKEIEGLMALYIMQRKEIIEQIDSLENTKSYVVLTDMYVNKMSFYEIADELHCSKRNVELFLKNGLNEFEDKFGANYLDNPTLFS